MIYLRLAAAKKKKLFFFRLKMQCIGRLSASFAFRSSIGCTNLSPRFRTRFTPVSRWLVNTVRCKQLCSIVPVTLASLSSLSSSVATAAAAADVNVNYTVSAKKLIYTALKIIHISRTSTSSVVVNLYQRCEWKWEMLFNFGNWNNNRNIKWEWENDILIPVKYSMWTCRNRL